MWSKYLGFRVPVAWGLRSILSNAIFVGSQLMRWGMPHCIFRQDWLERASVEGCCLQLTHVSCGGILTLKSAQWSLF